MAIAHGGGARLRILATRVSCGGEIDRRVQATSIRCTARTEESNRVFVRTKLHKGGKSDEFEFGKIDAGVVVGRCDDSLSSTGGRCAVHARYADKPGNSRQHPIGRICARAFRRWFIALLPIWLLGG